MAMADIIGRSGVESAIFGKPNDRNGDGLRRSEKPLKDLPGCYNPQEKHLLAFLKNELGVESVKTVSHLQDLGASSFHISRLASQLFDTYRIHLSLETILKAQSVHEIANLIEREVVLTMGHLSDAARYAIWDQAIQRERVSQPDSGFLARYPDTPGTVLETAWLVLSGALAGKPSAIPKRRNRELAHLSPSQARLWRKHKQSPMEPSLNLAFSFDIKGRLDIGCLGDALQELTQRHHILRTLFMEEDGEPVQKVQEKVAFEMPLISFADVPNPIKEGRVEGWLKRERRQPITRYASPLFRVHVLRLTPSHHILSFVASRLIFDEWSVNLLAWEWSVCYNARLHGLPNALRSEPVQFSDIAEWQASRKPESRQHPFWEELLKDDLPVTRLSLDGPSLRQKLRRAGVARFVISKPLTELLKAMARQQGATLFQIILSAFKIWVFKQTGQSDILIGAISANRKKQGLEGAMGPLANPLALRSQISEDADFETTLRQVARVCIHGVEAEDIPMENALAAANLPPDPERVLDVRVIYRDHEGSGLRLEKAVCEPAVIYHGNADCDLQLELLEMEKQINASFFYDKNLFNQEAVDVYARQFLNLTEQALLNPNIPIKDIACA